MGKARDALVPSWSHRAARANEGRRVNVWPRPRTPNSPGSVPTRGGMARTCRARTCRARMAGPPPAHSASQQRKKPSQRHRSHVWPGDPHPEEEEGKDRQRGPQPQPQTDAKSRAPCAPSASCFPPRYAASQGRRPQSSRCHRAGQRPQAPKREPKPLHRQPPRSL